MSWITILLLGSLIGVRLIYNYITKKENEKVDEQQLLNYQQEMKTLIEEREERENFTQFPEPQFWMLMDEVYERSQSSFKNSMGVFKDLIKPLNPNELIQLDNLLMHLFKENLNYDIYAASRIVFKTPDLGATLLLMNLLMTRGEVFFNNACLNPNLIIGKTFKDIDGRVFEDVVAEVYLAKTKKLIPEVIPPEDFELKISGKKWTEKELPSRYNELWFSFY